MNIFAWVALVTAAAGSVPLVFCAICSEMLLLFADGAVTISGILYATTMRNETWVEAELRGDDSILKLMETANAIVAVLFTLAVVYRVSSYGSLVGALRALWLIVIVTSSCGYASIRSVDPRLSPAIPNDLTIIAFGVGLIILSASFCVSMCRRRPAAVRDNRVILTEVFMIIGALSIRYQSSVDAVARVYTRVGWTMWCVCCHTLSLTILYLSTRAARESDSPRS